MRKHYVASVLLALTLPYCAAAAGSNLDIDASTVRTSAGESIEDRLDCPAMEVWSVGGTQVTTPGILPVIPQMAAGNRRYRRHDSCFAEANPTTLKWTNNCADGLYRLRHHIQQATNSVGSRWMYLRHFADFPAVEAFPIQLGPMAVTVSPSTASNSFDLHRDVDIPIALGDQFGSTLLSNTGPNSLTIASQTVSVERVDCGISHTQAGVTGELFILGDSHSTSTGGCDGCSVGTGFRNQLLADLPALGEAVDSNSYGAAGQTLQNFAADTASLYTTNVDPYVSGDTVMVMLGSNDRNFLVPASGRTEEEIADDIETLTDRLYASGAARVIFSPPPPLVGQDSGDAGYDKFVQYRSPVIRACYGSERIECGVDPNAFVDASYMPNCADTSGGAGTFDCHMNAAGHLEFTRRVKVLLGLISDEGS